MSRSPSLASSAGVESPIRRRHLFDSIYYMIQTDDLVRRLEADAKAADQLHAQSRQLLTQAIRAGAAAGLTQREIASAVGRSQPEVSRLLRFHGNSDRARALMSKRRSVLNIVREHDGQSPRVFGSVATGQDTEESDIDLVVDFRIPPSLVALARLERALTDAVGYPVEVTPAAQLPEHIRRRVETESAPL